MRLVILTCSPPPAVSWGRAFAGPAGPLHAAILPIALLALILAFGAALLLSWWRARAAVRAYYSAPLQCRWLEDPLPSECSEPDPGWEERGYGPVGVLLFERVGVWVCGCMGDRTTAPSALRSRPSALSPPAPTHPHTHTPTQAPVTVLIHGSLPIYALTGAGTTGAWSLLLTFYADGGQIATSSSARLIGNLAGVDLGAPRLLQLREGGTPVALDGQHAGSVQAWAVGGRQALPAAREALISYLQADHERAARALAARGWLSLPAHVRVLLGQPARVLRF